MKRLHPRPRRGSSLATPAPRPALRSLIVLLLLGGCAHSGHQNHPVSIDSRPVPPPPDTTSAAPRHTTHTGTPAPRASTIEADTTAVRASLRRCAGRKLLPEDESTVASANQLLADTRTAIAAGDLPRAESLARQARQLVRSLSCP